MNFKFNAENFTITKLEAEINKRAINYPGFAVLTAVFKPDEGNPMPFESKIYELRENLRKLEHKIFKEFKSTENTRLHMAECWKILHRIRQDVTAFENSADAVFKKISDECKNFTSDAEASIDKIIANRKFKIAESIMTSLKLIKGSLEVYQEELEGESKVYLEKFTSQYQPLNNSVGVFNYGTFSTTN